VIPNFAEKIMGNSPEERRNPPDKPAHDSSLVLQDFQAIVFGFFEGFD
jgi:hypothetical protein